MRISIRDNGQGMTSEVQEKIFVPFFTTKKMGTGLGLSITKRIISEDGGRIDVKSTAGEGTTFRIYLPMEEE